MPAVGNGVTLDNAVPPQRIAYMDDAHADVQLDQLGDYAYDYSKIWATMGRVGANGVVRAGMVEEGDQFNGWQAGTIEEVAAGAPVGIDRWNALTAYNPWGGLAAGDYCIYGCIDSWNEGLLHLAAGVPAPDLAYEYWTGAAWSALTMLVTPDWTCAGGVLNQRFRFEKPATWPESTPAQIGVPGLANPGSYYRIRFRLVSPHGGPAPQANVAYKDFFKGHWRRFFFAYDLKRGDDSATVTTATFRDDGNFSIKFRDGRGLEGRTSVGGDFCEHGSVDTQTTRHTLGKAWSIVAPGKRLTIWGGTYSNGILATIPKHKNSTSDGNYQIRSNILQVRMYNVLLNGHAVGGGGVLGSGGSTAVGDLVNVRVTPHPILDDGTDPGLSIVQTYNVAPGALVDKLIVDVRRRSVAKWLAGVRSSVGGALFEGVMLTDDDFLGGILSGQIVSTAGVGLVRNIEWGGPDLKAYAVALEAYRRLIVHVHEDGSHDPVVGIPIRITASDGSPQTGAAEVTDVSGTLDSYINPDWSGSVVGLQNRGLAKESKWTNDVETRTDEYMKVEVNPADHPSFNSDYLSLTYLHEFTRKLVLDFTDGLFHLVDWQRADLELVVALPRVVPPVVVADTGYERKAVPSTAFTPADVPETEFARAPVASSSFVRVVDPSAGFTPCDPPPAQAFASCDPAESTPFTHSPIPATTYAECGVPTPGKVLLLVPGMVMRLSSS